MQLWGITKDWQTCRQCCFCCHLVVQFHIVCYSNVTLDVNSNGITFWSQTLVSSQVHYQNKGNSYLCVFLYAALFSFDYCPRDLIAVALKKNKKHFNQLTDQKLPSPHHKRFLQELEVTCVGNHRQAYNQELMRTESETYRLERNTHCWALSEGGVLNWACRHTRLWEVVFWRVGEKNLDILASL